MPDDATPGRLGGSPERPARFFADAAEFGAWLALHHDTETELWMGLYKKHVPDRGLTWADAVPEALCWGWIDSVAQRIDEDATRQRWTPRRKTSIWSKVNIDLVEQLRAEGRMQPSGLAIWEARRRDVAPYTHEVEGALELPRRTPPSSPPPPPPPPSGTRPPRPTAGSAPTGCSPPSRRPPATAAWPSSSTARPPGS